MIMVLSMLVANITFAQTNFKWDKIDSVAKTKAQIYSDTKMYIAQTWNSAQDVIQNDDKEAGSILIKGSIKEEIKYGMGVNFGPAIYTYYYHYTITFLMKDNKFKLVLDNVNCKTALAPTGAKYTIPCLPPFEGENYPDVPNWGNLSKKKQLELMTQLKTDLQAVVDAYVQEIKKPSITNSGW